MLTYKKITWSNMEDAVECGGFVFVRNFDSGNLGSVEQVLPDENASEIGGKTAVADGPDYEFNVMTRPDCYGTEFENGNRTWFYFGVRSAPPSVLVKLNLVNLNKQGKMYSQGMAPVTKTVPGKPHWERIKDKPIYYSDDNIFTLSFKFQTPENPAATTYFAFTYPYTYTELQNNLNSIEVKINKNNHGDADDIYYCRECVCYSLDKRRVDLLTITSQHGKTNQREDKLKNLFPEGGERPFKFTNKKIVFVSARVHPGETPSSFVFNGFLNLLVNRNDQVAIALRRLYVFKLIPFLNPDGVVRGHYRTDNRGVNLNRVYQTPSIDLHPSVYAARALIRYYHFGFEKYDDTYDSNENKLDIKLTEFPTPRLNKKYSSKIDQENNEFNPKEKTSKKNLKFKERWLSPVEPKYQSLNMLKKTTTSPNPTNVKLLVDSEDDTSCSMSGQNQTLASQVEELNINQSSVDGYKILPSDGECANDSIIDQSSFLNAPNIIECDDTSLDTSNLTYDDDNDVIVPLSHASKKKNENNMNQNVKSEKSTLSLSACLRLNQAWCNTCRLRVKDLDSKMPGISQMLSVVSKADTFSKKADLQNKNVICVNCHLPIEPNGNEIKTQIGDPTTTTPLVNNIVIDAKNSNLENSNQTPFQKDVNKNNLQKNKDPAAKTQRRRTKSFSLYGRSVLQKEKESDLFLYIDLHGHASKKGIFMYGNHFDEVENSVECMLLPRIMSLNNLHFHFSSCNFTERNMYLKDRRDGMSREGSGRVAVLKATGLMRSYTLECNYNTGRSVNILPPTVKESMSAPIATPIQSTPPKYTPHIFEEVGKSLGASILDLTGNHPNSRIAASEHRNLHGIREWLRAHSRQTKPSQTIGPRQSTSACSVRPNTSRSVRSHLRSSKQQTFVDPERKENLAGPGYQPETRIASSARMVMASTARSLTSPKLLPVRIRGEQPLASKPQRNLSLISIKKPSVTKHPPAFKAPLRSKSPGPKAKFGGKQKSIDEPDLIKGAMRGLTDANRANSSKLSFKAKGAKANFKGHKEPAAQKPAAEAATTSLAHRKSKSRSKEATTYPRQPGQTGSKPLSKRLKVSQYIKYSDNAKEKYRIRKPDSEKAGEIEAVSSSVSSSGEEMVLSWDSACITAGSSGSTSNALPPTKGSQQRTLFKSRKATLHHLPAQAAAAAASTAAASDLGTIRHKFV